MAARKNIFCEDEADMGTESSVPFLFFRVLRVTAVAERGGILGSRAVIPIMATTQLPPAQCVRPSHTWSQCLTVAGPVCSP